MEIKQLAVSPQATELKVAKPGAGLRPGPRPVAPEQVRSKFVLRLCSVLPPRWHPRLTHANVTFLRVWAPFPPRHLRAHRKLSSSTRTKGDRNPETCTSAPGSLYFHRCAVWVPSAGAPGSLGFVPRPNNTNEVSRQGWELQTFHLTVGKEVGCFRK